MSAQDCPYCKQLKEKNSLIMNILLLVSILSLTAIVSMSVYFQVTFKREAVERGAAQYNPKTGDFEWRMEKLVPAEEKK